MDKSMGYAVISSGKKALSSRVRVALSQGKRDEPCVASACKDAHLPRSKRVLFDIFLLETGRFHAITTGSFRSCSGFVLPAVIILMLVVLLIGFGRLAAYRFQAERQIDRQKQTQEKLTYYSGITWLMLNLKKDSQWTGSETNWITMTSDTDFTVCGDGHRFEVRVRAKRFKELITATNEVLRADLTIPDTVRYTNVIVNGLVKLK